MEKISIGTIVRTIMMIIVIVNICLQSFGKSPIQIEESDLTTMVSTIIQIAIIAYGFWKNNSFTQAAIQADKIMKELKESEDE